MRKLTSGLALAAAGVCLLAFGGQAEATILNAPQGLRPALATVDVVDQVRSRRVYRGGRYVYVGPRYRYRRAYVAPRFYYGRAYVGPRYRYRRAYVAPRYYRSAYYGWPRYSYRRAYYGPRYYYPRYYAGPGLYIGAPGFSFGFRLGGGRYGW